MKRRMKRVPGCQQRRLKGLYGIRYGMVWYQSGLVWYVISLVWYGMVWYKSGVERGQSEYRLFITSPRPRIVIELLSAMPLVLCTVIALVESRNWYRRSARMNIKTSYGILKERRIIVMFLPRARDRQEL